MLKMVQYIAQKANANASEVTLGDQESRGERDTTLAKQTIIVIVMHKPDLLFHVVSSCPGRLRDLRVGLKDTWPRTVRGRHGRDLCDTRRPIPSSTAEDTVRGDGSRTVSYRRDSRHQQRTGTV